ncbi:MAG TPA: glutamate synthase subunit beta [Gemmatimonadaceae bacterium]|nr:glutamate synthase subunit beta [Gemmatimonadaceae bacterium]
MRDPRAFVTIRRATPRREPVDTRVQHWREFYEPMTEPALSEQGSRCMDCGVPFCHGDRGCPVQNVIPEWNALVQRGAWREALASLHATNNFPEFTGRLCPAPCESACVLGLIGEPVAIRAIEQAIVDRGFQEGWITPRRPRQDTGSRVAVVGSGPAGLAAAQQLRRAGHAVTVFEKADRIGGLLRYGIPSFKLEKTVLDRRLEQIAAEGVVFRTNVLAGADELLSDFDAVLLATGADTARDLTVPGRDLAGIELAMTYLSQQNRRDAGDAIDTDVTIDARDKHVVIVGGGDTGSDCGGTCIRQGARSVTQFELLPEPAVERDASTPWPMWPMQLRTSHAHEEGLSREWSVSTTAFLGRNGRVEELRAARVSPVVRDGRVVYERMAEPEIAIRADLVLLAMGFTGPRRAGVLNELGVELTTGGTVRTGHDHQTSVAGVFAAGDVRRGASLIVWAIREGRDAARCVDEYLRTRAAAHGRSAPDSTARAVAGR